MTTLNFMIWNGSPEIFSVGSFSLRWYGLLFALGFLISQQILYYIYRKEGKPEKDVETLTIYMVIATIIGARLGHVIFYQPELIWEEPWKIFLPFEIEAGPFTGLWDWWQRVRFTGLRGLASHGATIGILTALWLYGRKKKPGQSFLQVVDRIVILVALTGALIRLGNFFNSEIIGKPTDNPLGVVFVSDLTQALEERQGEYIESIAYRVNDTLPKTGDGRIPLEMYVFFNQSTTEAQAHQAMNNAQSLTFRLDEFFDTTDDTGYDLVPQKEGNLGARLNLVGIARHPAQLYESISCVFFVYISFSVMAEIQK